MHFGQRLFRVLLLCLVMMTRAVAGPPIPDELQPWTDWVLRDVPDRGCTLKDDQDGRICVWPGTLEMVWTGDVIQFQWRVNMLSEAWLTLPGEAGQWPFDVRANGREIPVLLRHDKPAVRLAAGQWTLTGRLRPETERGQLGLPVEAARVVLKNHRDVVTFGTDQRLHWHQSRVAGPSVTRVRVHRLLTLGRPPVLETHIQVESGTDGEVVTLGPLVPEGYALMSFESPLPARLEPDGQVTVQLASGTWQIKARLRALGVVRKVSPVRKGPLWPEEEVWSVNTGVQTGRVSITGQALDPALAEVPQAWQRWGAWKVTWSQGLELSYRDGPLTPASSSLNASTNLWWVRDAVRPIWMTRVTGTSGFEGGLRVASPWHVLRAESEGRPVGIQILEDGRFQIPFERARVDLQLTGMLNAPADNQRLSLPMGELAPPFKSQQLTVHAPVGQMVVAIFGADHVQGSWLSRWTLWDLFFSALVILAIGRTWGLLMGGIALPVIMLSYHEPWAPVWIWLLMIVAWALPDNGHRPGKWVRRFRWLVFAVLVMQCVTFAVIQGQRILYPQLAGLQDAMPGEPVGAEVMSLRDTPRQSLSVMKQERVRSGDRAPVPVAPDVLPVEVGPGLPAGHYVTASARIDGPLGQAGMVDIWRLGDTGLRLVRAAVLAGLVMLLLGLTARLRKLLLIWGLVAFGMGMPAEPVQAQTFPPDKMLESLREVLLKPPACMPDCVRAGQGELVADAYSLSLALVVSADVDAAWRLPVLQSPDMPVRWFMDGTPVRTFMRDGSGQIWIRVPAGVHELVLNLGLREFNALTLSFPEPPLDLASQVSDWTVEGLSGRQLAADRLTLKRIALPERQSEPGEAFAPPPIPAFVGVHRHIELGRDWRLTTQVTRRAPAKGALSVSIPLLAGESPLGGVQVVDRHAVVTFRDGQQHLTWTSTLPAASRLTLQAPGWSERAESWSLYADSRWRITWSGLQPVRWQGPDGRWQPQWQPEPGDQVVISVEPATLLTGQRLNVDRVSLTHVWQPERHQFEGVWQIRATAQDNFSVGGLAGVEALKAWLDGQSLPVTVREGVANWSVPAGMHELRLTWAYDAGNRQTQAAPLEFVGTWQNLSYTLRLPESRWLLWLTGPTDGPAILLWGGLLVLAVVAIVLGRHKGNPLTVRAWLLLAAGGALGWMGALPAVVLWVYAVALSGPELHKLSGWPRRLALAGLVLLTIMVLVAVLASIPRGLTGLPPDYVVGAGSHATELHWQADWVEGRLPDIRVWTLPLWVYRALMWAWSLWLAFAITGWLKWAWQRIVSAAESGQTAVPSVAVPEHTPEKDSASTTLALKQEKNDSHDAES
ncbi:hypothetical protein AAIA72_00930 [Hahella sp. SMD15-11]|uniref:Uncharacterized protein n=1 Tax=Thermohahella caldifontis TaxID=3142973 RepID=A0AB39UW57_9GAMM